MAVEARRACGWRKVGGIYLCGDGGGVSCDRLPIALTVCPCCNQGIKQTRGWTWIDISALVGGVHLNCLDEFPCPLCMATPNMGKCGMLWIGEQFYRHPQDFLREADQMGISRRISAIPRGFVVGETWVLLAHPKAVTCLACNGSGIHGNAACKTCNGGCGKLPGIFRVFKPSRIEKIVTASEYADTVAMDELRSRGLTPIPVPDNDPDHRGSVYDKEETEHEV